MEKRAVFVAMWVIHLTRVNFETVDFKMLDLT